MSESRQEKQFGFLFFYAAVWGILEATLGWALHFIAFPVSGFIMFPIALFILTRAYQRLQSSSALIIIGLLAALIKLVDLFLPGLPAIKTVNPAVALIIEACFAAIAVPSLVKGTAISRAGFSLVANLGWRGGFLLYGLFLQMGLGMRFGLLRSADSVISFLLINGIVSSVLCWAMVMLMDKTPQLKLQRPLVWAVPLFAVALGFQFFL